MFFTREPIFHGFVASDFACHLPFLVGIDLCSDAFNEVGQILSGQRGQRRVQLFPCNRSLYSGHSGQRHTRSVFFLRLKHGLPFPHPLRPLNQRGGIRFRPQLHFLFMGDHAVEHVPHFVAQFDMQIERVPVHAHEPFAEAGKHAFELRRGSLAFPQVLFKTAREHFLFGAAARVFLQIVGQGVKFRAAVSGMFLIAVVFRLQRRVVIHGRRPLPQGGKIGQHPFVGQPFPFQPFHLQKEDMGRLVGEGGQVRAPEKPDDVIARSVKRGGAEGLSLHGMGKLLEFRGVVRYITKYVFRSHCIRKLNLVQLRSLLCVHRLLATGRRLFVSGEQPCFLSLLFSHIENSHIPVMANGYFVFSVSAFVSENIPLGDDFHQFSRDGFSICSLCISGGDNVGNTVAVMKVFF